MTVFPTASHLVSWARWSPQVKVRRETQRQQRHRPRQPLPRRRPWRERRQRRAHPVVPGRQYGRLARRMPKKKSLVATGNSMLTIMHALLSDPAARYTDLGAGDDETRMHARQQARNHIRSLERLGYQVTIQAQATDSEDRPLAPAS